jgi:hypothetical protein
MSSFKVNLGINDLQKKLADIKKYDTATQEKMKDAVRTTTTEILMGVKRRIPVRTGKTMGKATSTYNFIKNEGKVSIKSPIAHLIEFGAKGVTITPNKKQALHGGKLVGFASKVTIPARKAHPMMRPAFEDAKPNLMKAIEDAIKP